MCAGIKLVIAENIERIYGRIARTWAFWRRPISRSSTKSAAARRSRSRPSPRVRAEITRGIIEYGGLFNYNVARLQARRP